MKFKQMKTLKQFWLLMFLSMFFPATVLAQNAMKVTGTVLDENGDALIGATVAVVDSHSHYIKTIRIKFFLF